MSYNKLQNSQTSIWFIAKITGVCPTNPADSCSSYTCSWTQYVMCDNMQKLTTTDMQLVSGDCVQKYNIAVPIDETEPTVGAIVLMRQRGTYEQEGNIYEFVNAKGQGKNELAFTALQCSAGILSATYSDGCHS